MSVYKDEWEGLGGGDEVRVCRGVGSKCWVDDVTFVLSI